MGCPRSATSCSAGAAAASRSPEEAPVDPSPAPVDRRRSADAARRPDVALAGADGASATPLRPRAAQDPCERRQRSDRAGRESEGRGGPRVAAGRG